MPWCLGASGSVRAPTQYQSAKWAEVVQVFCPLRQPSVAVAGGLELHRRRVRAGVGLGVAHGELDFVAEDLGQELLLQLVAPVADDGLADDADALADLRSAPGSQSLVEQVLVDALAVLAAVLLGPGDAQPPLFAHLGHELPSGRGVHDLGHVLAGEVEHLGIVVGVEEFLDLLDEFELFGREFEVHGGPP